MSQYFEISETSLGREIFGPLGGIVELGAVADAHPEQSLENVSLIDFVTRHQKELDEELSTIQRIGNFTSATMAVVDELGWHRSHEITAPSLLLWSGGIEEFSPQLSDPASVRRMVRTGGDLQMTNFLHALVSSATYRQRPVAATSQMIIHALRNAASLLGRDTSDSAYSTFRMWRVAFLPQILMPSAQSPSATKSGYRSFAHALEESFTS
ncbi:hypothetical protein ACPEIF_19790 [Streptomyces sp. NPDC012600]|uniref:hypothetical protein n=1 Tax=Streptomyces sp. NPDC012600 TaxID=3415005 RepID=UPI003C3042A3